jgi:hypothetical protein
LYEMSDSAVGRADILVSEGEVEGVPKPEADWLKSVRQKAYYSKRKKGNHRKPHHSTRFP